MKTFFGAAAALALMSSAALAAPVSVETYDMVNGTTGSFNYWDDTYDGTGDNTTDNALLSGGTGDLTDGIIADANWNSVEGPLGPNGPYVGWTIDPIITFNFASDVDFTSATFHFDDSEVGGVDSPTGLNINGVDFAIADPLTTDPFAVTVMLDAIAPTDQLVVEIFRRSSWIFLSEVTFDGSTTAPVPLPAGGMLLLTALGGMAVARRRKG
ncbi:VPLPA-CTERM sorting domain-containing protein [Primorskyibacter sp. S187A]|uniref:VPLPA-CTERM sorting domain-containing protein n=1 Tax=Primorskyibacter sp. S187A TaxID=3415130 RepID=UPI003C7CCFAC